MDSYAIAFAVLGSAIAFLAILILVRCIFNRPKTPYISNMNDKVIIITGSSSGIGKASALDLIKNGSTVVFANRDKDKTDRIIKESANPKKAFFIQLDLSSFNSIVKFSNEFSSKFNRLNILINNASVLLNEYLITENGLEKMLQINLIGHIFLTILLLRKFSDDARIINISCDSVEALLRNLHQNDFRIIECEHNSESNKKENQVNFLDQQYSKSKLGMVLFTKILNEFFVNTENYRYFTVNSVNPGIVNTNLYKNLSPCRRFWFVLTYPLFLLYSKSPDVGCQTILHLCYINQEKISNGGHYANCEEKALKDLSIDYAEKSLLTESRHLSKKSYQLLIDNFMVKIKDILSADSPDRKDLIKDFYTELESIFHCS